jgi:hypothetical protein
MEILGPVNKITRRRAHTNVEKRRAAEQFLPADSSEILIIFGGFSFLSGIKKRRQIKLSTGVFPQDGLPPTKTRSLTLISVMFRFSPPDVS